MEKEERLSTVAEITAHLDCHMKETLSSHSRLEVRHEEIKEQLKEKDERINIAIGQMSSLELKIQKEAAQKAVRKEMKEQEKTEVKERERKEKEKEKKDKEKEKEEHKEHIVLHLEMKEKDKEKE